MKTYTVHAKPWERGWELHIDGVGVTQSHTLDDAEPMARDYIALALDIPRYSFRVVVAVDGPDEGDLDDMEKALRANDRAELGIASTGEEDS